MQQSNWVRGGAPNPGFIVAGHCIVFFASIGFGMILMSILFFVLLVPVFEDFKGKGSNPARVIAICLIVIGGFLFLGGIVLTVIAKRKIQETIKANDDADTSMNPLSTAGYSVGQYQPDHLSGHLPPSQYPGLYPAGQQVPASYSPHGPRPYPSQSYAPEQYYPYPASQNVQPYPPQNETSALLSVNQPPTYGEVEQ